MEVRGRRGDGGGRGRRRRRSAVDWGWDSGGGAGEADAGAVEAGAAAGHLQPVTALTLADAVVRQWTRAEWFDFWIADGGTRARGLKEIVWAAAALSEDEDDALVFFARMGEGYGGDDWASGSVAELRGAVVDLVVMTISGAVREVALGVKRGEGGRAGRGECHVCSLVDGREAAGVQCALTRC